MWPRPIMSELLSSVTGADEWVAFMCAQWGSFLTSESSLHRLLTQLGGGAADLDHAELASRPRQRREPGRAGPPPSPRRLLHDRAAPCS